MLTKLFRAAAFGAGVIVSLAPALAQEEQDAAARLKAAREVAGVTGIRDVPPPMVPDEFIVARDPPGMHAAPPRARAERREAERPQAVNGQNYTVIAPMYLGGGPDGGNTSYIRFFNRELTTSTFRVSVVGYTSSTTNSQSTVLGTALITVPKTASPQYSIGEIQQAAFGSSQLPSPYTGASLYVTNVDDDVGYQHVIHNANSRFFENVTLCADESMSDGSNQRYMGSLINVHTYNFYMTEYPASLVIHNYGSTDGYYEIYLVDSRTGAFAAYYPATLQANTTYVIPIRTIQQFTGWNPTDLQSHVNIQVFRTIGGQVQLTNAVIGQLIYNQALQAYVNMSQICTILH